jgi:hypothetical protein
LFDNPAPLQHQSNFDQTMYFVHFLPYRTLLTFLLAMATAMPTHAGNIGFSISFTGDDIAITNTGSEPAYQLSEWTLDATNQWRKAQVLQGNASYLAPGKTLKSRRLAASAAKGIGRADPVLLLLHDQAGSPITQLAWRQTLAPTGNTLPYERQGTQLRVSPAAGNAPIISTDAIVLPYAGIARLAQPFAEVAAPRQPVHHVWAAATPLLLETGNGQSGAWLVHETAAGELSLQIIPDGVLRGQEQVPGWLHWVRLHLLKLATTLAGAGLLWLVLGSLHKATRSPLPGKP